MNVSTGIAGLDDILHGGLAPGSLYLIEGVAGSGKTTMAMQCLIAGVQQGEKVLYVTLSESARELRVVAQSHGWALEGIEIYDVQPAGISLDPEQQYTIFHPAEVELSESTRAIMEVVERVRPTRVVLDSLSEFRMLAGSALTYRRQILSFKQYFASMNCMLLLLDDLTGSESDLQVRSIAHGVIRMEQMHSDFGAQRRRLIVHKLRASSFREGYHDYVIRHGGLVVFPRLVASEHKHPRVAEVAASGISGLDELLGGGLELGSSTLIVGAAGSGKSSISSQFVTNAAATGDKAAMFIFDEIEDILLSRAEQLGMPLRTQVANGSVRIQQVDPAEMSPGELVSLVRAAVDWGAKVVVIDSLNGYLNAMPGERFLIAQLHELLTYLNQRGVVTILVSAHHGIVGTQMSAPVDASYLADAVILLRYFEWRGTVRQAISVMKKRSGSHERSIRELRLETGGIRVGSPLTQFRGVLTGTPTIEVGADQAAQLDF